MEPKTPSEIKEFKAQLFIFFSALPPSLEKNILEQVIRGVNQHHDQELKSFLLMIHNKILKEKNKQTSKRDTSLLIWGNIMKVIKDFVTGVNVGTSKSNYHHNNIVAHNHPQHSTQAKTESFAMLDNAEEEGMA